MLISRGHYVRTQHSASLPPVLSHSASHSLTQPHWPPRSSDINFRLRPAASDSDPSEVGFAPIRGQDGVMVDQSEARTVAHHRHPAPAPLAPGPIKVPFIIMCDAWPWPAGRCLKSPLTRHSQLLQTLKQIFLLWINYYTLKNKPDTRNCDCKCHLHLEMLWRRGTKLAWESTESTLVTRRYSCWDLRHPDFLRSRSVNITKQKYWLVREGLKNNRQ